MSSPNPSQGVAQAVQKALSESTYYFTRNDRTLWHVALLDFDPQLQIRRYKQTKEPEDDVEIKYKLYKAGDKEFNRVQRSKLCKVSDLGQKVANIEVRERRSSPTTSLPLR